jgi:hypothetical protein
MSTGAIVIAANDAEGRFFLSHHKILLSLKSSPVTAPHIKREISAPLKGKIDVVDEKTY